MGVVIGGAAVRRLRRRVQRHLRQHRPAVPVRRRARRVGGYASAILSDRYGVPMLVGMLARHPRRPPWSAGCSAGSPSAARSTSSSPGSSPWPSRSAFQNLLLGQRDLTGGETGLVVDAGADTLLGEQVAPYYVFLALVVGYLAVFRPAAVADRVGVPALRDDEVAAELAGVDVKRYRVIAGVLGAAMIGLAGALYAHSEGFISPSTFAFGHVDVRVIVMVAFGGIGSLLGPVVGAAAFTILDEWLVSFNEYRLIIYGAAIIVLFLVLPRGVVPTVQSLTKRRRRPSRTTVAPR